jgi:pimeloyl-ACP methyl ester carboxylesterase
MNATEGDYAEVNGLRMYYEVHGEGRPLVLLHGAYMTVEAMGPVLPGLAETRRVIVPEMQGHGRTADIDRPITYEGMADDVAALLGHLGIEEADAFGYSMGGGGRPPARHPPPGLAAQAGGRLGLLHERRHAARAARDGPDHHARDVRRVPDGGSLPGGRA